MCTCVLPACCLCTTDVQCSQRPEEGVGYSGTGVPDCCKLMWCSRNPTLVLWEKSHLSRLALFILFYREAVRLESGTSCAFTLWVWGLSKRTMTMCVPVRAAVFHASRTGMWGGAECTGRGLGTGLAGWAFHLTEEPHWASTLGGLDGG